MEHMPQKPAFYLDTQICTGCKTCMLACKDKTDLDPGVRWRRVVEYTGGDWLSLPLLRAPVSGRQRPGEQVRLLSR